MKKEYTKAKIVEDIKTAAHEYKDKLVGKSFLYVFEGRSVEVVYRERDFLHLTGVDTKMSSGQFFKDALRGRLQSNQIFFSQRHPYELCAKKLTQLINLPSVIDSDVVILEDLTTDTFTYQFGVTDLVLTIGLSEVTDGSGKRIGNYYFARTLRIEDSFSKSADAFEVNFVLTKKNNEPLYNEITYDDHKCKMSDLPEIVLKRIDSALYKDATTTASEDQPADDTVETNE